MTTTNTNHAALNAEITDQPAVYVGTYGKYNNGSIAGSWVDLTEVTNYAEFMELCAAIHSDETDPEFMFQDFQGFPRPLYHESTMQSFFNVWEYILENLTDYDMAAVWAWVENGCTVDTFEDAYSGEADSENAFAEQLFDEIYLHDVPASVQSYIDYDKFTRDLFMTDYVYLNGYVFRNI